MGDIGAQARCRVRRCGFCDTSASDSLSLMKCSGCMSIYYCNREHQQLDWKRHKPICKDVQAKRVLQQTTVEPASVNDTTAANNETSAESESALADGTTTSESGGSRPSVIQSVSSVTEKHRRVDRSPSQSSDGAPQSKKTRETPFDVPTQTKAMKSLKDIDCHGLKKDHGLNFSLDLQQDYRFQFEHYPLRYTSPRILTKAAQYIAASLREYGWAVVDKFAGREHCSAILNELLAFHGQGVFTEARMLKSKSGGLLHGVRADQIYWLANGSDQGVNIGLLGSMIDSLIIHMSGSLPPYKINGRTKPMLTCYPGQRSRYVVHVDNPDNDGRCLTATYYLNEDWCPAHGGLLRMYPISAYKPVDIEPIFDRLVLYWSDRRNPHEVLPTYRKRFSINIWYFDAEEKAIADSMAQRAKTATAKKGVR